MNLVLRIWRQAGPKAKGRFEAYPVSGISPDYSFLEVLDRINEELISQKREPVAFEMDCREGICGSCSLMIDGRPHGPQQATTTCQLYMRHFHDGQTITGVALDSHGSTVMVSGGIVSPGPCQDNSDSLRLMSRKAPPPPRWRAIRAPRMVTTACIAPA